MSVITVDFGTRRRGPAPLIRTHLPAPRPVDIPDWWTCPSWCDPEQCIGGNGTDFGNGHVHVAHRHHNRVIYSASSGDSVGNEVTARVEISVVEEPGLGWPDPPTVDVDVNAVLEPAQADEVAAAVVYAAALARQPLPATSSRSLPYAGGGRASTPLEAS